MDMWVAILAGGEGTRLRSITSSLEGDDRPKQFCRLLSGRTLIGETLERVTRCAAADHCVVITTRHHRRYYTADVCARPPRLRVEQPRSAGTTAAIAYGLGRVRRLDPNAILAVFPSDHYFEHPAAVEQAVWMAAQTATLNPTHLVLVGAVPDQAEAEYGWIVPGAMATHPFTDRRVFEVSRFQEKPSPLEARSLLNAGGLWNTFITVGHVRAFDAALGEAVPAWQSFARRVADAHDWTAESALASSAYDSLPASCFSAHVLTQVSHHCLVTRMAHAGWIDVGQPQRLGIARSRSDQLHRAG